MTKTIPDLVSADDCITMVSLQKKLEFAVWHGNFCYAGTFDKMNASPIPEIEDGVDTIYVKTTGVT